jgi:hypothetical protein
VNFFVKGCTYQPGTFIYDQFTSESIVKSISLKNGKNGVELTVFLKTPADSVIKTHSKGNLWLALLSSKPQVESNWSLSGVQRKPENNAVNESEIQSADANNL